MCQVRAFKLWLYSSIQTRSKKNTISWMCFNVVFSNILTNQMYVEVGKLQVTSIALTGRGSRGGHSRSLKFQVHYKIGSNSIFQRNFYIIDLGGKNGNINLNLTIYWWSHKNIHEMRRISHKYYFIAPLKIPLHLRCFISLQGLYYLIFSWLKHDGP